MLRKRLLSEHIGGGGGLPIRRDFYTAIACALFFVGEKDEIAISVLRSDDLEKTTGRRSGTAGLFVFFPLVFQFFKVLSCRGFRVVQGFFESFLLIFHLFDGGFLSLFDLCQLVFREIRFYLL